MSSRSRPLAIKGVSRGNTAGCWLPQALCLMELEFCFVISTVLFIHRQGHFPSRWRSCLAAALVGQAASLTIRGLRNGQAGSLTYESPRGLVVSRNVNAARLNRKCG